MKKLFINLIILVLFGICVSCSQEKMTIDYLEGKWRDEYNYPSKINIDGVFIDTFYENIMYKFKNDFTFEVENELPYSINKPGTYSINGEKIILVPNSDPLNLYKKLYEWKITYIDDQKLDVVYKYTGDPIEPNGQPIVIEYIRNFSKVK